MSTLGASTFGAIWLALLAGSFQPGSCQSAFIPGNLVGQTQIAQAAPPQFIPTDVTPFTVNPERNAFSPGYKFRIFKNLPERLWFTSTTEVSQRLDTNVLFTANNPKADYAFRVLPNVTVGYNIFKHTSIFANYFVIKDTFAVHNFLNPPTTQSVSWGIRQTKQLSAKTGLQFDIQAREIWQASHLHQFDFIPGAMLTHVVNPNNVLFASALLQLRGGEYFVAPTREIDPFYTVGFSHRQGYWTFVASDTLVTNFRHPPFNDSIPPQSNVSMITDLEVNHPITKRLPSLVAFVRAEPVFNWDSHRAPGLSGFDFRLYGGLRFSVNKPSYYPAIENLRKQIQDSQSTSNGDNSNRGTRDSSAGGQGSASTIQSTTSASDSIIKSVPGPPLRGQ